MIENDECPECHGEGYTREWGTIEDGQAYVLIACWACGGSGLAGGKVAQRETEAALEISDELPW